MLMSQSQIKDKCYSYKNKQEALCIVRLLESTLIQTSRIKKIISATDNLKLLTIFNWHVIDS